MISRSFYQQVVMRVILITCTSFFIFLLPNYISVYFSIIPFLLIVQQTIMLIKYVNRSNEKISLFFHSVKNEDFSLKFSEDVPDKSFRELYKRINEVNLQIQEIFIEKRTQDAYFKEVLRQIDVGILSYNKEGHILFANQSVKNLFNCKHLNHIRQIESINASLFKLLSEPRPFGRKLVEISNEREVIQLALKSSLFKSADEPLFLLTVQDIRRELDEKETDSWLKLIRVLTHEIMNMVTPITSITGAILDNLEQDSIPLALEQKNNDKVKNTIKGLEVINEQGKDLMSFVQSYRSFLNVPNPQKEVVKVADLFDTMKILFSPDLKAKDIQLKTSIEPIDLELFIDRQQIVQVLLNLGKNAIQSLEHEKKQGIIQIHAGINETGNKFIEVRDNGPGIQSKVIEHIFIPFFTTKDSGSGIGLSLSKQILQLHGGTLQVHSVLEQGTSFYLSF